MKIWRFHCLKIFNGCKYFLPTDFSIKKIANIFFLLVFLFYMEAAIIGIGSPEKYRPRKARFDSGEQSVVKWLLLTTERKSRHAARKNELSH